MAKTFDLQQSLSHTLEIKINHKSNFGNQETPPSEYKLVRQTNNYSSMQSNYLFQLHVWQVLGGVG